MRIPEGAPGRLLALTIDQKRYTEDQKGEPGQRAPKKGAPDYTKSYENFVVTQCTVYDLRKAPSRRTTFFAADDSFREAMGGLIQEAFDSKRWAHTREPLSVSSKTVYTGLKEQFPKVPGDHPIAYMAARLARDGDSEESLKKLAKDKRGITAAAEALAELESHRERKRREATSSPEPS